jgi:hypothetical protein
VLGVYAKEQLAGKKVGVLFRDDDFGKEYMAGVAGALGGTDKIAAEPYVSSEVDVAVQVGQLKDAGVEVLVLAATRGGGDIDSVACAGQGRRCWWGTRARPARWRPASAEGHPLRSSRLGSWRWTG